MKQYLHLRLQALLKFKSILSVMSVKIDSSVIFSLSIKKLSNFLSSVKLIKVSGLNFVLKMEIKSVEKLNPYLLNNLDISILTLLEFSS